jgi:hypothetical protein
MRSSRTFALVFVLMLACVLLPSAGLLFASHTQDVQQQTPALRPRPWADARLAVAERGLRSEPLPKSIDAELPLRALYLFVGSHLKLMTRLPCYCGCDQLGHGSVAECFVEPKGDTHDHSTTADTDTAVTWRWSKHAAGCGMCMAIAHDAMEMQQQNLPADVIRQRIETTYHRMRASQP